eukprot:TRINITY_DN1935_c0_g1_i15.p1 TRINITY_DN1935_c0_g1~~TRINITY_DN1935_c0_g1_i15.p1  ORF type:complete len:345 (-),score=105.42 TRINITY_DN1935_c0_g1_i15:1626-2660(-)
MNPTLFGANDREIELTDWIKKVRADSDAIAERTFRRIAGTAPTDNTDAGSLVQKWLNPTLDASLPEEAPAPAPARIGEPQSRWSAQFSREVQTMKRRAAQHTEGASRPTRISTLREGSEAEAAEGVSLRGKSSPVREVATHDPRLGMEARRHVVSNMREQRRSKQATPVSRPAAEAPRAAHRLEEERAQVLAMEVEVQRMKEQLAAQAAREDAERREQEAIDAEEQRAAVLAAELAKLAVEKASLEKEAHVRRIEQARKSAQHKYKRLRSTLLRAAILHIKSCSDATMAMLQEHSRGRQGRALKVHRSAAAHELRTGGVQWLVLCCADSADAARSGAACSGGTA